MKYCKYCMAEIEDNAAVCPLCGRDLTAEVPLHHLQPGTVLSDRYVVGAALGEGGFGITYIGLNKRIRLKAAIKEFFPLGFVNRVSTVSTEVTERTGAAEEGFFAKGREKFLSEACLLAQLSSEPGVVSVYDFFEENNTAYIVMEYLEGQTLKAYLNNKGRLSYDETMSLLMPVMKSLSKVHEKGLIHRDISPDNIMITDGIVKLLDFGSARYADGEKSLSVMLKHGYAPIEQYKRKGEQGPWTDVYSVSATIYKCITGATPDEATDRVLGDGLKKPSEYGAEISPECEAALMKGLAVNPNDRYRTVKELIKGLTGKDESLVIPAASVDNEKTVFGETGPDPDKTVFEYDPDKTVFTNKPEYNKKPEPAPVYKEKTDEPKEKQSKKTILLAFVVLLLIGVIIGCVMIMSYRREDNTPPILAETETHGHTYATEPVHTDPADTDPAVITDAATEPGTDSAESKPEETEPAVIPVTTDAPETEKPGEQTHTHTYGSWTVVKQPTCTEEGKEERKCSVCGETESRSIAAKGHSYGEWKVTKAPTETSEGTETKTCSVCGDTVTRSIDLVKHNYVATVTAPTCTEQGYTTYRCSDCGKEYTDDYKPALGHNYGSYQQIKAPTCTETGTEQRTCSRCGDTETRTVAALGHDFGAYQQTKDPTCTETGEEERTCSDCGEKETRTVAALGHNYGEYQQTKAPTCTETGTEQHTCTRCGNTESRTVAALGHDYGGDGICKRCGEKEPTPDKYFKFTLSGGGYEIKAKDKNNMPAEVVIPSTYNGKSVTSIGDKAFYDCSGLTSITIPDSVTSIDRYAFSGCSNLTSITIPDSVTCIRGYTFNGCSALTSITIGNGVTSIGEYAFYGCSGLTSVTIGNGVTSIGERAFRDCSGLKSVTIGNGVTSIGETAFAYCSNLTSITIPDGVTSIGDGAFAYCSNLTSITIPDGVTSMGSFAFYGCSGLTNITIGNGVTSIGQEAFHDCSGLTSVTIGNGVTSIGFAAFLECKNLTSITIPDSVTSIGEMAFCGCSALTSVTIGNGVTSIGYEAFRGCSGLTSITIPDSVTSIYGKAFSDCSGLTSIIYKGTKAQWDAISKGSGWNYNTGNYTVHCTDGDIPKN